MTPEYDPGRGIIRLSRAHLEGIVGGDAAVLDPHQASGGLLGQLGILAQGRLDPSLRPVLATLRRPSRRFGLRVETSQGVTRHRGWIAPSGVVTVTGGPEPTDVQDIRVAARPSAAPRVLARLIGLGPSRRVDGLPERALSWDEVMVPVRDGPGAGWAAEAAGSHARWRVSHLRWSGDGRRRATTAMALLLADADGLVEAFGDDRGFRLLGRSPTEVWTGLCVLTRPG